MLLAVNNGYWATKVCNGKGVYQFRTKFKETLDNVNVPNTYLVKYKDKSFCIGDGADTEMFEYDKTKTEIHKLCTLIACFNEMNKFREEFQIVSSIPLKLFQTQRIIFENYIKTDEYKEIVCNGVTKQIYIKECRAFPETMAAVYSAPHVFKNKVIGIIDAGGLTVNGCIIENMRIIPSSIFTINEGGFILFNKLRMQLNKDFLLNLQSYQMPEVIKNGLNIYGKEQDIQKKIDEAMQQHAQEIKNQMQLNNWSTETLEIVLIGGTSQLIYKYLVKEFPQAKLHSDPIYANAKGLYEVGKVVFANARNLFVS